MKLFTTKSKRKHTKYDLLDENKNYILSVVIIAILTIQCIKTLTEKKDTYLDTARKITQRITLNQQHSCQLIYYGVNQHYKHQFVMLTKDLILI